MRQCVCVSITIRPKNKIKNKIKANKRKYFAETAAACLQRRQKRQKRHHKHHGTSFAMSGDGRDPSLCGLCAAHPAAVHGYSAARYLGFYGLLLVQGLSGVYDALYLCFLFLQRDFRIKTAHDQKSAWTATTPRSNLLHKFIHQKSKHRDVRWTT